MGEEQKAVKTKPFDLQLDPAKSDMSLHKLDKAKDKNFCSIRERRNEEKFNAVALRHLPR